MSSSTEAKLRPRGKVASSQQEKYKTAGIKWHKRKATGSNPLAVHQTSFQNAQ